MSCETYQFMKSKVKCKMQGNTLLEDQRAAIVLVEIS